MIFDLAIVEDSGTFWTVTGVIKNTMDQLVERHERPLRLSFMSQKIIRDALQDGKLVHITKKMQYDEVLPVDIEVIDVAQTTDPLAAAKQAAISSVRVHVIPEISKIAGLTLYSFIVLNNDLASAGYFITDKNREEMYINVLETGDETLIQKLEDYLNARDEIDRVAFIERRFNTFRRDITNATTVEEVDTTRDQFMAFLYNAMK
jgi:hypothetical protein